MKSHVDTKWSGEIKTSLSLGFLVDRHRYIFTHISSNLLVFLSKNSLWNPCPFFRGRCIPPDVACIWVFLHLYRHYSALPLLCHLRVEAWSDTSGSWEPSLSRINGPRRENDWVEGVKKFPASLPPPRLPPRVLPRLALVSSAVNPIISRLDNSLYYSSTGKRLNYAITIFAIIIIFVRLHFRKMTSTLSFVCFFSRSKTCQANDLTGRAWPS